MAETMRGNGDGTWSEAQPMGWQPGIDGRPGLNWEAYTTTSPLRAVLYDKTTVVAEVTATTHLALSLKMRGAQRRYLAAAPSPGPLDKEG